MDLDELDSKMVFEVAKILHLGERASMDELKARYRDLMKRWHPDNCRHDLDLCKEKAEAIVNAYEVIVAYCSSYVFSFIDSDIINSPPMAFGCGRNGRNSTVTIRFGDSIQQRDEQRLFIKGTVM